MRSVKDIKEYLSSMGEYYGARIDINKRLEKQNISKNHIICAERYSARADVLEQVKRDIEELIEMIGK